jgi:hypothetical protein
VSLETLYHVHKHVIPAAMALLPGRMDSPEARAMLLAVGLQESEFEERLQVGGPARSFWQFEKNGGVKELLTAGTTLAIITAVAETLRYSPTVAACYDAIADNDTLACIFARLLLWGYPGALPRRDEAQKAWIQYRACWRPGKPRPNAWPANFEQAWHTITNE